MGVPGIEQVRARLELAREQDEVVTPMLPPDDWNEAASVHGWPTALTAGVIQSRRGYHFRPENSAWVGLLETETAGTVFDLGAGNGSLILGAIAALRPRTAVGVEVQPSVADRLRRTLEAHECGAHVITADVREPGTTTTIRREFGLADLVVTNPPFYPEGWGRPSENPEVQASTHCLHGDVRAFLQCAESVLAPEGVVWLVYDAGRLAEAFAAAGQAGLGLDRLVWIPDGRAGKQHLPTRVWLRLRRDGAPIQSIR